MRRFPALVLVALALLGSAGCGPEPVPVDPAAGQRVVCQGVPEEPCRAAVDGGGPIGDDIVQVVVRCTVPVCTPTNGEADVTILYRDGRRDTGSYGWAGAQAAPEPARPRPVPLDPVCLGVPPQQCQEMAATALEGGPAVGVGSITVDCSAVCTPERGSGQTTIRYLDGTPARTSEWQYESGG